ncbi:MAG: PspC domain-containing protein [Caldilineales bacterium]|nr:PspC domain-containing protein [Caldilineales bacterium]MDW8318542.1 PspC domain-containing protein [Anaerolineae bacterium]
MDKRLYRSRTERVVAGVCGGLGAYFGVDPVLIRVLAVILGFISFGTAILLYVALAFLIPLEPETSGGAATTGDGGGSGGAAA